MIKLLGELFYKLYAYIQIKFIVYNILYGTLLKHAI